MMMRRLLLGIISLAIILACYLLYTMLFTPPVVPEPVRTTDPVKVPPRKMANLPSKPINIANPEDVVMAGEGDKPYFERYSQGRLLYQFRSDHWKPIESTPGRFALEKPELRLFMRGGQLMQVSASEGEIEVVQTKRSRPGEPRAGELRGKVHIFIDRGTDPNRSDPELRPEDIVHIWLDHVKFDLIRNTIQSDSLIKVESDEVDMTGQSIFIRWTGATNQIEEITIRRGDKLILRQGLDLIRPDMPFTQNSRKAAGGRGNFFGVAGNAPIDGDFGGRAFLSRNVVAKSEFVPNRRPAEPATKPLATAEATARDSAKSTTQPRAAKSYDLVFTSAVKLFQYDGPRQVGTMTCDRLHVIFDLPRGSESQALGSRPATTRQARQLAKDDKRLEIFWEGPLQMKPIVLPYSPVRRFHIEATGQPIQIDQAEQGSVRCKVLKYHQESKRLFLDGTTDEPVKVAQVGTAENPDRTIVAVHLFYDRKLGIASGTGPGYMQQDAKTARPAAPGASDLASFTSLQSSTQKIKVLWMEGFRLNFGEFVRMDAAGQSTKQYLKRAEFRGSAQMLRQDDVMAGDLVVLNFQPPASSEDTGDKISTLHAERGVVLRSGRQEITCGLLDVEFGEGNFGRIPKVARARQKVRARERQRVIAGDLLTAYMEDRQVPVPMPAPGLGHTGPARKTRMKTEIVLREVDAAGNVRIHDRDSAQKVEVDCQKLHAMLDPDGKIRWCYLEGTDQKWARAELRDNVIAGRKVTMDLATEEMSIPGPGELQFVNNQDIDGARLSKPTPIAINWSESMKLTGGTKNQGTFLGNARVRSNRSTLYCDKLLVDFENAEPTAEKPAAEAKPRYAILQRILGKTTEESSNIQLPVARKRPTYIQGFPAPGKKIVIQNVAREGDRLDSRTTLTGNEITLDMAGQRMNVPGVGNLFIEDYRARAKTDRAAEAAGKSREAKLPLARDPFGADMQAMGPTQTVFSWKTGLTYQLDTRTALFDGQVSMLLVAGKSIVPDSAGNYKLDQLTRHATLYCDNLKVEFMKGAFAFSGQAGPETEIGKLKSIIATGSVNLQDKPRSVIAQRVMYNQKDNAVAVYGTEKEPAYLYEEDDQTGQYRTWSGPFILWDRANNHIVAPNAAITTTMQ